MLIELLVTAATATTCNAHIGGALPDPHCTPGATNPAVTQATIQQTICMPGWTSTIRPPVTVTEPQKFKSMREYGISTVPGQAAKYEYDHLIPLELGGAADDTKNLWPEAHNVVWHTKQLGSYIKDALENRLRALVCTNKLKLATAQHIIATDWRKGLNK